MPYIDLHGVKKQYGEGDAVVQAVKDINVSIEKAEWIAIMGKSGSGKSTLLSIMGALNTPSSGAYRVNGIEVYSLGQEERADFRRNYLGFVFQSFHLVPYLTVEENVLLPLTPNPGKKRDKILKAKEALSRVGLQGKGGRLPMQISGGEQERVAIARAIVNQPPILLADEPTGNLDSKTTREIMELFQLLHAQGMTIVTVTHNPECARYAGRIFHIADGLVEKTEEVPPVPAKVLQFRV
jgi:putative ABC transport system ATP-binding protein